MKEYKGAPIPDPIYPCRFDDCVGEVDYPPEKLFYWNGQLDWDRKYFWDNKYFYKPGFYCESCLVNMGLLSISTITLMRILSRTEK